MLTQIASTVLYAAIAASVLYQVVTVARLTARAARKRSADRVQPVPLAPPPAVKPPAPRVRSRLRRRDYRLALRAAKASVSAF